MALGLVRWGKLRFQLGVFGIFQKFLGKKTQKKRKGNFFKAIVVFRNWGSRPHLALLARRNIGSIVFELAVRRMEWCLAERNCIVAGHFAVVETSWRRSR